jgi:superfamily II DNA or RNA helicase
VDPTVVRALLCAAYLDADDDEEARRSRSLSANAALETARSRLGEPPGLRTFTDSVYDCLRERWLPRASAKTINELTATVRLTASAAARREPVDTKRRQIDFLQSRRWSDKLRTNIRKAFIKDNRVGQAVEVVPGQGSVLRAAVELVGLGAPPTRDWYPHQVTARARLDDLWKDSVPCGACLVLPTGAGKTDTIVGWLLSRLDENKDLRVLWLVHQQELVDQALGRFVALASQQKPDFMRRARAIHSAASMVSTLREASLSVAVITYQSFRSMHNRKKSALETFLSRPTIVVVDEAHHVGSNSFDSLLELIERQPEVRAFVGLTATPYPSAPRARARFMNRFPHLVYGPPVGNLIQSEILAQPVVTTIDTGEVYDLTDAQVAQATSSDIPDEVLKSLDAVNRNRLIAETWKRGSEEWGKTLVFATSIDHAEKLADALSRREAQARALHSATRDRIGTLKWFRSARGSAVLVSVGMLTEGVDLPDARTAFLARPTTSPIVMRQMVGRVLRGPKAGGESEAHVVYFRDKWSNLPDVLYPEEVLPDSRPARAGREKPRWAPGPVIDDDKLELRTDLAAQIEHAFEKLAALFNVDDDDPFNDLPPEPLLREARIVGFYDLIEIAVPVFEHQLPGYEALLADAIKLDGLRGSSLLSYFDDSPPPYPSPRALKTLVALAREFGEIPCLESCNAPLGPGRVAKRILDSGALTERERSDLVLNEYERSLNRVAYSGVEAFEEAVEQELRELRRPTRRLDAESPPNFGIDPAGLERLARVDRDLEPIKRLALKTARVVLPAARTAQLRDLPEVRWTKRCAKSTWGHWSLNMSGRGKGRAIIRMNRVLRTRPKHVPDDMLAYLVFHELLHHLLPGQSHDVEFRKLESLWPAAGQWDLAFDTLHEKWDLRPESYRDDIGE